MKGNFIRLLCLIILLLNPIGAIVLGQNKAQPQGSSDVSSTYFSRYLVKNEKKRKVLSLKGKSFLSKVNPMTYVSAGLIFFYQRVISEQIQASCMYEVSCSENMKNSIAKFGFFKGLMIGTDQWNSCTPGVLYENPDYMRLNGKVRNSVH